MSTSINQREIENFAKDSAKWWDESGPFAILHRLNPVRMEYILGQTGDVKGRNILDVGCGGGLVCEPLARLGANVTGIDADSNAIEAARSHAKTVKLGITYQCAAVEDMAGTFDIVLALEILEHVNDPAAFLAACAKRVKPGGLLIVSTLNRTPQSFALGIVAAEYIMRYVPRGTHDWKKFIKPSELMDMAYSAELALRNMQGLVFDPLSGDFSLSESRISVNYFMCLSK